MKKTKQLINNNKILIIIQTMVIINFNNNKIKTSKARNTNYNKNN